MNAAALRRLAATKRALVAACPRPLAQRTYATNEKDPQLGDYPQFPPVHRALLPPKGWWDNQMRRNFGDIPHEQEDKYSMWGPDPPKVPPKEALFQFSIAVTMFGGIMLFAYTVTPERTAVPRQYPFDGLVKELGGLEENKAVSESLEDDVE